MSDYSISPITGVKTPLQILFWKCSDSNSKKAFGKLSLILQQLQQKVSNKNCFL